MRDVNRLIARRKLQDRLFSLLGMACTLVGVLTLVVLLSGLIRDGSGRLFDPAFYSSFPSARAVRAGILSPLVDSLLLALLTVLLAVPLGVAAGVYLEEYAPRNWLTTIIEINIANLAGVEATRSGASAAGGALAAVPTKVEIKGLNFFYGAKQALKNIQLAIPEKSVTALIGPSGCGKTTLLRCLNRMHDLYPGNRYEGEILLQPGGLNIISGAVDPMEMRLRVGMVFQKPNPFPKSIFENVAFGLRLKGVSAPSELSERVEHALRSAALWEEVKDRLRDTAYALSGGQQQRLCIARALAPEPELMLFDEPTSALDPASTARIEDLVYELRERVSIVIVTHNMQQAARVSDQTVFFYQGEVIEANPTSTMFEHPREELTRRYLTGQFG